MTKNKRCTNILALATDAIEGVLILDYRFGLIGLGAISIEANSVTQQYRIDAPVDLSIDSAGANGAVSGLITVQIDIATTDHKDIVTVEADIKHFGPKGESYTVPFNSDVFCGALAGSIELELAA
jgi:hypothetical protein